MKDLYKRLGLDPSASPEQVRAAIESPAGAVEPADLESARDVLLDPNRRAVYDRTRRVLTTIGHLRAHLGLNYKTFWARGRLKDFTYDLSPPATGKRRRRVLRSLRPSDISRAFGLSGKPAVQSVYGEEERTFAALTLISAAVIVIALLIYVVLKANQ